MREQAQILPMSHFAQDYNIGKLLVVLELPNSVKDPVFEV